MKVIEFRYDALPISPRATKVLARFRVTGVYPDGERVLGVIEHKFFAHIEQEGWEATGSDGHRAVHEQRSQAAQALAWNGRGYPFPFRKEV